MPFKLFLRLFLGYRLFFEYDYKLCILILKLYLDYRKWFISYIYTITAFMVIYTHLRPEKIEIAWVYEDFPI